MIKVATQKVSNPIAAGGRPNGISMRYDSDMGIGFGATLND